MKIVSVNGYLDIRGASSEEKPTEVVTAKYPDRGCELPVQVSDGDTFVETDTGAAYIFSNGAWNSI